MKSSSSPDPQSTDSCSQTFCPSRKKFWQGVIGLCVLSAGLLASPVQGASATWSATPGDGNWLPGSGLTNWSTGVDLFPGSTSGLTSADVATFNSSSTQTTIAINSSSLNVGGLTFDTGAASYTIGSAGANAGNSLLLSSGGAVQIASGLSGSNLTQTVNAPVVLEPTSSIAIGTYSFTNNSATSSNVLRVAGNVTGGTTSFVNGNDSAPDGGSIVLGLSGSNTGANVVSGVISDGGAGTNVAQRGLAVRKSGAGTWNLTGTNTFTGIVEVSQGILNVASVSDYGVASAIGARSNIDTSANGGVGILINGGTLQYTGSTAQSTNRAIRLGSGTNTIDASGTGSGTLSFTKTGANPNLFQSTTSPNLTLTGSNTGDNTFAITLTNGVSVVKNGAGTWVLSGASTNTGGLTINAGTIKAGSSTALGNGALTFGASSTGKLQLNGNSLTVTNLNTNASVGTPIVENGLAGTATLTVSGSSGGTYAGVLQNGAAGVLALTKSGASTLTLSGANTYTGATTISGGTLLLGASNVLADTTAVTLSNSSKLELNGFNETIGGLASSTAGSNIVQATENSSNKVSTLTVSQAGDSTFDGILRNSSVGTGNSLAITKQGAGNLTLKNTTGGAANSYTGVTTISGGTLTLSDSAGRTIGSMASAITNNATLALEVTNANTRALATVVSGSGNLVVTPGNVGTVALSAANTFTGTTKVNAGTLALANVNALQSSALDVTGAGAVTFTVAGTNTYNIGGLKNDAGTGTSGTLTLGSNSLSLSSSATSSVKIASISDFQGATAAFEVNAGLTLNGAFAVQFTTSFAPGTTATFNLYDATSPTGNLTSFVIFGNYAATLTGNAGVGYSGFDALGNFFSFNNATGDLAFTAVPEPRETALAVGAALFLLVVCRRRSTKVS